MALLNAFVDSVLCVGFSSESGITIDPESKNDESFYTSYLQSTILAIVTSDRAIYPPSHGSELYDSAYPPTRRLSTHSNASVSISSGRSTPSSSIVASIRTPKHHMIPPAYKDLPFFCFPDGVQATYQREKEKIHHFVLTHGNKRSYALALTFQQQFTLRSNKPDDDGVYQIKDYRASTGHTGRSTVSRIPVPIEKPKPVSPPSPTTSPVKMRSKKMPSSYRAVDANSNNQQKPSTTSSDATKQQQPLHHYEVQTYSSYQKSLAKSAAPPPLRAGRTQSQDNLSQSNTPISTTSGSTGMRKRSGSTLNNSSPANATHTSIPIPSSSASSSPSSITTTKTTISTSSHDTVKPFYLPHCIVLISNEPYWTALQETISIIHDELTRLNIEPSSKTYKKLIQKYAFLACNTPIPPVPWERFSLSFNVTNDQFVITFEPPINPNRPVLDLDLSRLLLTLNIGKLLDVLAAIFTEQPIIFFSTNYSTLVTTLECILYLIYPLKWTNVYLPLIPDGLRDIYLEGPPGLYLKGAHSRHQAIVEQLNTSIICNLDTDKNIFVPKRIELHRIPPTKINSFIDPITQLLEEIKVARALKSVPTAARLRMEQERELERQRRYETNQKIIKLFLSLMIDICGDVFEPIYWKVNSQQISPTSTLVNKTTKHKRNTSISHTVTTTTTTTTSVFSKEQYLLPKSEGIELEFYRAFVETIAFQNLLKAEMLSTSSTSFKQICQLYSLKNEDQFCDLNNASANMLDDESKITLCDPLTTQMLLPLPDWSSDLSIHYLDNCIDVFTDELENAQEERSSAVITVYSYLRGCARLARGDYLEGLRDLYSIENEHLFPKTYIETVVLPRLAEDNLLNLFLNETYYTKSPEWKKVHLQSLSPQLSYVDLEEKKNLIEAFPVHTPSPDVTLNDEWSIIVENTLTYEQFSERVHRFNIVLDKETTETLFRALLYWTDSSSSDTLKKDKTLTNNSNNSTPKPIEPPKSAAMKTGQVVSTFTFEDTMRMVNNRRNSHAVTPSAKSSTQSETILPTALYELFIDIWQQQNTEKVRMNRHLPEDRQKQESVLKISSTSIVSKKDGPGQIILTQKRLYFLPETRSSARLLSELLNITSVDKYQHQSVFSSSKPGLKIHTSSTSSLPRDSNVLPQMKASAFDKDSKSISISLFFKNNQEQELWYTILMELWSGLVIAYEQCDTAVLNKASRHIILMDTLANIDYNEEPLSFSDKQLANPRQKSRQHHNEVCLEMALKDLSTFTRLRQAGMMKPLSDETRKVLTRRLSPSINETERHAVRSLIFIEHPDTGHSSLWCAYGLKLKVFNVTTWICDPNDICFSSLITTMCIDGRYKLWLRCINGQLFIVDTITRRCEAELTTNDRENACHTIVYDPIHNQILTANRNGTITIWNASNWEYLYDINVLDLYKASNHIQDKTHKSQAKVTLHVLTESPNMKKPLDRKPGFFGNPKESMHPTDIPDIPSATGPAQIIPSPTDKLERLQVCENLLFACYRDDYIIILRKLNANTYTYEHLISVKYKFGDSVPIDSFVVYDKQLWASTGSIISIFNINKTNDENPYNLLMKTPVDDDNLVTMLGFTGYIWAGSLNGNVYVFRMDNYELYKTFTGHRDSVWCLCSMLDTYIVSGSAQNDTSIAIWENIQQNNIRPRAASATLISNKDSSIIPKLTRTSESKVDIKKPIDIL